MKIIISRKGFDSQYGGQPSPILPDGTLLSLPIPMLSDQLTFDQLSYGSKTYLEIIRELRPNTRLDDRTTCHLDPDIRKEALRTRPQNWKAIFGQCDAAQGHLKKMEVSAGDLFLFFGWFKQTEEKEGRLQYKPDSPDLHIIYGYLQIGELYTCGEPFPLYTKHHTHARSKYESIQSNCIYISRDYFSLNQKLGGAGCLRYHPDLVLTKEGFSRSKWHLPPFFRSLKMTYHNEQSFKADYFQSVAQGQEFVIGSNEQACAWAKHLIEGNCDPADIV